MKSGSQDLCICARLERLTSDRGSSFAERGRGLRTTSVLARTTRDSEGAPLTTSGSFRSRRSSTVVAEIDRPCVSRTGDGDGGAQA